MNDISLTIRLPHEINLELANLSKNLGITKTNLIRNFIHELSENNASLVFANTFEKYKKDRIVLNVNKLTHDILLDYSKKYDQSINSVVIAVCILSLNNSKWL